MLSSTKVEFSAYLGHISERDRTLPDVLTRIRSPLLCPLSYGRIRLVFSHEGYCSASVVRIVGPEPKHLCRIQEGPEVVAAAHSSALVRSSPSAFGSRHVSALGRISVSQCEHDRHYRESHAAEEIGAYGYEAGGDPA